MASEESQMDPVGQLAEEFVARYRRGERPALSEYTEKHPELAERIHQVFPMMVMMEEAGSGGEVSLDATRDPSGAATDLVSKKLERVGGFHILREVGRGGMGVVYEAEQVALGRHVALKVLPLHAAKEGSGLERFRREAKAAAKLHHSNIVPIYEVGEDGDYCYYAMQFIHGQPLDQVLDEVRQLRAASAVPAAESDGSVAQSLLAGLPTPQSSASSSAAPSSSVTLPGQADPSSLGSNRRPYHHSVARVGIQVAQALAYAHQEGVIHRDIKPSNLLLDTESRVWITDFGLAKMDGAALTHTGDVVGTVRYMAPERFNGWSDPRSDVYSLGITLYEMLLLRPAFEGPDRMKLIHQVTHEEPPRPRKLEPNMPRDLETIVLKAIDREPGRRYQTAAEMAKDLQRFVDDRPILARRITQAERTWRWCKRNPVVAGLIAAVILVTAFGFAATLGQMKKANVHALQAQENAEQAYWNAHQAAEKQQEALQQRDAARTANEKLLATQEQLRGTLYAAHMNLTQTAWEADNVGRVLELLSSQVAKAGQADLRGFEWYYWQRLCHAELSTVKLEGAPLESNNLGGMALSPGGSRLAAAIPPKSGGGDFQVKIWDTTTGKELLAIPVPAGSGSFIEVTFSRDGARLATIIGNPQQPGKGTSPSNEMKIWDAASGKELLAISSKELLTISTAKDANGTYLASGIFSPDGARLATVTSMGWAVMRHGSELKVWDASSAEHLLSIPVSGRLAGPVFSPDGTRLAACVAVYDTESGVLPRESRVHVWDAATGKELLSLKGLAGFAHAVAFSPDGGRIAAYSGTLDEPGAVKVWAADSGKELWTTPLPSGVIRRLLFSPDGKLVAGLGWLTAVKMWDATTGKLQLTLKGHTAPLQDLVFRAGGQQLLSAASDGTMKVWNTTVPEKLPDAKRQSPGYSRNSAISPDGTRIARAEGGQGGPLSGSEIKLLDTAGRELSSFHAAFGHSHGMAISPDGRRLAVAWHLNEGPLAQLYELKVWDTVSGKELFTIPGGGAVAFNGAAFSPDNTRIATAVSYFDKEKNGEEYVDSGAKIYDATSGKELLMIQAHSRASQLSVAFSPDGTCIATSFSTYDGTAANRGQGGVHVWEAATGNKLFTFEGRSRNLGRVAFSPDGRFVAAASGIFNEPGEVEVWQLDSSQGPRASAPPFILKGHSGSIGSMAFSPDGRRIATAAHSLGGTGEVKIWDAATYQELLTLKDMASSIDSVAFSPDGRRLLGVVSTSGQSRKLVQIWDATPLPEQSVKAGQ